MLTSSVPEEKKDILAYFKRVKTVNDQEDQSYKSSIINNSDVTECSSSEGDEIKPGKNEVFRKKNISDPSSNCKNDLNIKDMILDLENLTDEIESRFKSENGVRAKGNDTKVCSIDDKGRPIIDNNAEDSLTVCCIEKNKKNDPFDNKSPKLKNEGCLVVETNGDPNNKVETKKSPTELTGFRKNAFTLMMANRVKQAEEGSPSLEEETLIDHGEEEDVFSMIHDENGITLSDSAVKKCETEGKTSASQNTIALKKNIATICKSTKKGSRDKNIDLDSSLQDFDLVAYDKPKQKRYRKHKNEKKITTTSTKVAMPVDLSHLNSSSDEKPSNYISFTDYIKSTSSVSEKSVTEGNISKKSDEIKKEEETMNVSKTNDLSQKQATNSNCSFQTVKVKKREEAISNLKTNKELEQTIIKNYSVRKSDEIKEEEAISKFKTNEFHQQQTANTKCTHKEANEANEKFKTGESQEQPTTNNTCTSKMEGEVKKNVGNVKKLKKNESQHQKITNSNFDSTDGDSECCNRVLRKNVNASVDCDELEMPMILVCSSQVNEKQDDQLDQNKVKEVQKAKQMTTYIQTRKAKKNKIVSSDSEEDFKTSKAPGISREKISKVKEDTKNCSRTLSPSNISSISSFFSKINQKEKDEKKNVFTVQADVHAPLDGIKTIGKRLSSPLHGQSCGELGEISHLRKVDESSIQVPKKSAQKIKMGAHNSSLDELNKIELLEQIPPSKAIIKRVLRKVEKLDEDRNEEYHDKEIGECKAGVTSKKGELYKKKTLSGRKRSFKNSGGVRKKSLRRKKSDSSSSEESTEELFIREKNKLPLNYKDTTEGKDSSSSSLSTDRCLENAEKSSSLPQSSDASEDDKENVAHYTSQLLRQPGKLRLVLLIVLIV